jgi:hypothetical protein
LGSNGAKHLERLTVPKARYRAKGSLKAVTNALPQEIVERDDGLFEIAIGADAAGPFPSRTFAQAIANRETGDPPDKRRRPRGGKPEAAKQSSR